MNLTIVSLLSVVSLLSYAFIAYRMVHLAKSWERDESFSNYLKNPFEAAMIYFVVLTHFAYVLSVMKQLYAIDMALLKMLNLTFWFMFLTVRIFVVRHFSPLIFFIIVLLNILILSADLLLPVQVELLVNDDEVVVHALISVLAYSLCGLVVLQTVIFSLQERGLRSRRSFWWLNLIPSLEQNEKLFYDLSGIAFIGLSLSMMSGVVVLEDWLAQQVSHKTVFTFLAWLILGVLLGLRKRYILNPQQSSRWALGACVLLIIGVVGSKIVLEFILIS